jgi:hypothetical protein
MSTLWHMPMCGSHFELQLSVADALHGALCDPQGDVVFVRPCTTERSDTVPFGPFPGMLEEDEPASRGDGGARIGNDIVELQSMFINEVIDANRSPRNLRVLSSFCVYSHMYYFRG